MLFVLRLPGPHPAPFPDFIGLMLLLPLPWARSWSLDSLHPVYEVGFWIPRDSVDMYHLVLKHCLWQSAGMK